MFGLFKKKPEILNRKIDELTTLPWSYETDDNVWDVSVSADGSYIAAGSRDKVYFFNFDAEEMRIEAMKAEIIAMIEETLGRGGRWALRFF